MMSSIAPFYYFAQLILLCHVFFKILLCNMYNFYHVLLFKLYIDTNSINC